MKKPIIIVFLLSIIISGCISAKSVAADPTIFSILYNEAEANPFQNDWLILNEYEKKQNVKLDVTLGDNADYEKVIIQSLESGNIPDIILKVWPETIESYASSGILLPFSDYEDRMPYFMEYIKENNLQPELDKLRLDNGEYYILPGYQRNIQVQQWIYRRDVFEENNLETPDTYDELFDSLLILKELYPDSAPITATWGGAHLYSMIGAGYGIPAGWAGTRYYNKDQDLWQFSPATKNYQELLRYLNRCYNAGLLDPEIFTLSESDYYQKLVDGRSFITVSWITSGFSSWNEMLQENGFTNGEWAPLPVPESTIGIKALPPVELFRKGLIVPARVIDEPYFEDLLRFLDWAVYSDEGMTLTTWGVEGITYENTSDGKVFLPEIKTPKNPEGTIDITQTYGLDTFFNLNENEAFEDYKKPPEIVAFLEDSMNANDAAEISPKLNLDPDAVEAIKIVEERILPYVDESREKFIIGELDIDHDWDEYLIILNDLGYKTIEEIWNISWEKQNN